MRRIALIVVLLGAIAGVGLFAYSIDSSAPISSSNSMSTFADPETVVSSAHHSEAGIEQTVGQGEVSASDPVAHMIGEATSDDPTKRAAAIEALGAAPKALAIPVLQKVLSASTDGDRQLALSSLRTLALDQGDDDGIIRDTLRLTVYDGDDYVVADVQATLEDIERNLDEVASNRDQ